MSKLLSKLDLQGYITLSYLGGVAVGMMFDYQYYDHFAIDIFEYSDILDFLLTPVRNLEVIVFVLATLGIVWTLFKLDDVWKKRSPNTYNRFNLVKWQNTSRPFMYALSVILYLFIAASIYGDEKYKRFLKAPSPVSLTFESGSKTISGSLIGKNKDYLFLQDADSTVKAIPINADVQEIVIQQNKEK